MREAEEEVRVIPCEKDSACIPDPKDGGRGHKPRNATGWPLIVGKGKEMDYSLESPEGNTVWPTLWPQLVRPLPDF